MTGIRINFHVNDTRTGVAGAGGILVDPGGQVEHKFSWGLGPRTNNEAEWMALLQGLHLIRGKKLWKVLVFDDSRHVIYKMINGYPSGDIKCGRLYKKAKLLLPQSIEIITFFAIITRKQISWLMLEPVSPKATTARMATLPSSKSFHDERF